MATIAVVRSPPAAPVQKIARMRWCLPFPPACPSLRTMDKSTRTLMARLEWVSVIIKLQMDTFWIAVLVFLVYFLFFYVLSLMSQIRLPHLVYDSKRLICLFFGLFLTATCEMCGMVGVRDAFYSKTKRFCSVSCSRSYSSNSKKASILARLQVRAMHV